MPKQIFLSYCREDRSHINTIHREIKKTGNKLWYDNKLFGGQNFEREIKKQINKSACVVTVISQDTISSKWVSKEIRHAADNGIPVIPILKGLEVEDLGGTEFEFIRDSRHCLSFRRKFDPSVQSHMREAIILTLGGKGDGKVVSFVNFKGGVGKTTLCAVSGTALAKLGYKVLLIDVDPQENLSDLFFGPTALKKAARDSKTVLSYFEHDRLDTKLAKAYDFELCAIPKNEINPASVRKVVAPAIDDPKLFKKFDMVPGDFRMMKFSRAGKEIHDVFRDRFFRVLAVLKKEYDFIFLDCGPSASLLSDCCLHLSDAVIAPVRANQSSVRGLFSMRKAAQGVFNCVIDGKVHPVFNFFRPSNNTEQRYFDNFRSDPGGLISRDVKFVQGRVFSNFLPQTDTLIDLPKVIANALRDRSAISGFGTLNKHIYGIADEIRTACSQKKNDASTHKELVSAT